MKAPRQLPIVDMKLCRHQTRQGQAQEHLQVDGGAALQQELEPDQGLR